MPKPNIDISLEGVWDKTPARPAKTQGAGGKASRIDIPLDGVGRPKAGGAKSITEEEFEFVNRHHEEYKELRRRAREQGGR